MAIKEIDFERFTQRHGHIIGNSLFLAGHLVYLLLFHCLGVTPMERFNYFSVTYYAVMLAVCATRDKSGMLMLGSVVEFILHAVLSVYYVGWDLGFQIYMLIIAPVPFFPAFKRKYIPFLIELVNVSTYCALKSFSTGWPIRYSIAGELHLPIYLLNSLFGFTFITCVSFMFLAKQDKNRAMLESHNKMLMNLANIDPLTQLYNRRAMFGFANQILEASRQSAESYVVGLADIDDFKKVNDTYGHVAGDEVLVSVAKALMQTLPEGSYACRWGGEELLFAIPGCTLEEGCGYAQAFRNKVMQAGFQQDEHCFRVTVTVGVCEGAPGEDFEHVIRKADDRLYIGKTSGKNVVISSDSA